MPSRREFILMSTGLGALCTLGLPACTLGTASLEGAEPPHAQRAIAVTRVLGDGVRLIAVAVEYSVPVAGGSLNAKGFSVTGRTITSVFSSTSADPADRAPTGRFVIVMLSLDDPDARLTPPRHNDRQGSGEKPGARTGGPGGRSGPGKAGQVPAFAAPFLPAHANVRQTAVIPTAGGRDISAQAQPMGTDSVRNLVVDEFRQATFHDPDTDRKLRYNLFVPKAHDRHKPLPLVLFMHDAGATSNITRTTLFQGLGAIAWANPEDQEKRPCFVLAPQYAEIITDDESHASSMLDTTIHLIRYLTRRYGIDNRRLYATGQSGGCMMAIAMNIRYPDFFAASFLVAGQWDPKLASPLARQKLWIVVSEDDQKAFPGENAIVKVLEQEGTKVSHATWDARWSASRFRTAFASMDAAGTPVNYVTFAKGSVFPPGESTDNPGGGHTNTWRVAYTIEPIREWIFRQHR